MNPIGKKIALGSVFAFGLLGGCGAPQTASLSGSVESGRFALDNPVVIAEAASGARYVSYIHPDLTFVITAPVGDTYALSLANSTRTSEYRVVAHINVATDDGPSRYVTLTDAGSVDVGTVQPIDWNAATTPTGGLGTLSSPNGNGAVHAADHGKPGDDGDDGAPDDVSSCDPISVLEAKTTIPAKGVHGGGGGGGSAAPASGGGAGEVKVTICHIPPGNPANAHTITVGAPAVPAHLAHGDYVGACLPAPPAPGNPQCPPSDGGGSSSDGGTATTDGGSSGGGGGGGGGGGDTTTTGGGDTTTTGGGGTTTTGGGGTTTTGGGGTTTTGGGGTTTTGGGGTTTTGGGTSGSHCLINADCAGGLVCVESTCGIVVL